MAQKTKKSPEPAKSAKKAAPAKPAKLPAKKTAKSAKPASSQAAKPKKPVVAVPKGKMANSSAKKPTKVDKIEVKKPKETPPQDGAKIKGFLAKQRQRLLDLKDMLLDSMSGVGRDSLRSRAEGSEASAFGQHQADAGSDAYDRDFALGLLSREQDSLYEIDEALKRIESGSYGICEMCNKQIPHIRLEALPFTRYTVDCQAELEKRSRHQRVRQPVTSLFGLNEDEGSEGEDEESNNDTKE